MPRDPSSLLLSQDGPCAQRLVSWKRNDGRAGPVPSGPKPAEGETSAKLVGVLLVVRSLSSPGRLTALTDRKS